MRPSAERRRTERCARDEDEERVEYVEHEYDRALNTLDHEPQESFDAKTILLSAELGYGDLVRVERQMRRAGAVHSSWESADSLPEVIRLRAAGSRQQAKAEAAAGAGRASGGVNAGRWSSVLLFRVCLSLPLKTKSALAEVQIRSVNPWTHARLLPLTCALH
ncbi:hypothetical protein AXG93_2016s1200 [Marchantia polymorpha subsp. ruderalis]|uniref:Uncharacterized protein n=1 Tax=Marchantia polymorpha subsp. ruderalis TaxID=1480154 RepID=A0A176VX37_MARPO|nr:hypothetical protein AXG93_2016s1200 [Marchantia polymorpha subsp. ruderalis]